MASHSTKRFALLHRLANEFAERNRLGERPALQEYVNRHPELADDIRELFPLLVDWNRPRTIATRWLGPRLPVSRRRWVAQAGSVDTPRSPLWADSLAVVLLATVVSLIVAVRSTNQSRREALAAEAERTARADAERARQREVSQREQAEATAKAAKATAKTAEANVKTAEAAAKAAEAGRTRAIEALQKAEENFARTRTSVQEYLTAASSDARLKSPGLSPLRDRLLRSALGFYQQFLLERGTDPALRRELAAVYEKVGTLYRDLGQQPLADRVLRPVPPPVRGPGSRRPDDREIQDSLAKALHRQGQNERAIAIWEKLVRPDDPRYQADLGNAYNDDAFHFKDDPAKFLEFLRKALMIRERLVRLRPHDPDARLGLATSLNQIALQLKEDRHHEALTLFHKALEQGEIAYRLDPSSEPTTRFLVTQLDQVATRAKASGLTEEELAAHRRRIEVLDRRARDNPGVAGFDADLVQGYADFLEALRDARRWDEAAKVAHEARERIAKTTEETTAFFEGVRDFHLAVYAIVIARAAAAPPGEVKTEPEAVAVVNALRKHVLAGWRDFELDEDGSRAPNRCAFGPTSTRCWPGSTS